MSDKMAVMMNGEVLQYGPPDAVYTDPQSLAVAQFIGAPQINTLAGEVDSAGRLTIAGAPCGAMISGAPGPVTVGIRPEHLALSQSAGLLVGTVRHAENLGSDVFVHFETSAGRALARCTPHAARNLGEGQRIALTAAPEHMLVFGTDGARRAHAAQSAAVPA